VILARKQQELLDDLLHIDDLQERLASIVDRAKRRPKLELVDRTDENRVKGCISAAWVVMEHRDGRCFFRGDADSPLVRGLVLLLCDFYSGAKPEEIVAVDPAFLELLGFSRSLSPTRLNGLRSVRARIREFAAAKVQANA
jgi:cysteine desulfuration protein SufE